MLFTLLLWLYTSLSTFLAGDALLRIGHRVAGPLPTLAMPLVCLLGAAGLTALLGWGWLLVPINLETHLLLAGLLLGYGLWQRPQLRGQLPRWHTHRLGWFAAGVLFTVVLVRSSQLPRLADTGGYHAPMIEWIHQYAIVPGLANLNYRFGFNNSWFLLSAFFRFQLTPTVPWHGLNGWLMVMMGWLSLTEWQRYPTSQQPFSAWLGTWLTLGLLLIFHWTLASPSPDLPTHIYVLLCFWVWLRRAESDQKPYALSWAWLLLVLSLSALTTKLSSITVLVLPALVAGQILTRYDWRRLGLFGATMLVFTGYWWIGNVVLSGYLAYPSLSPLADWFTVDWKVPRDVIAVGLQNLQLGTRGDLGPAFSLTWVPYWFKTRPVLEQLIFVALLPGPLVAVWSLKRNCRRIAGYGAACLTAWLGVIFWFLLAPEIRFGAGTVSMAVGLSYGPVLSRLRWPDRRQTGVPGVLLVIGLVLLLAAVRREPVGWLLPAGYPVGTFRIYTANGHLIRYPVGDLRVINGIRGYWGSCYDGGLPCSPYPMPDLRWRGTTRQTGFQTVQSNTH